MTDQPTRTFGECFMNVMCRPSAVMASERHTETRSRMVTTVVHDPFCTRSPFMHGMVDGPCMVHLTMMVKE